MEKSSDAMKAREALNGKIFDGRKIEVGLLSYYILEGNHFQKCSFGLALPEMLNFLLYNEYIIVFVIVLL